MTPLFTMFMHHKIYVVYLVNLHIPEGKGHA